MTTSVVVTGASGFLGEHVCASLRTHGYAVTAMARSGLSPLSALGCTPLAGDVMHADLAAAFAGHRAVLHLAGMVSRKADDATTMMRLHVDGTRRVLHAAKAAGVTRVIVASTSGTIAVSKSPQVFDETFPYATETVAGWPYYASKIYQETLAFDLGAKLGLEVVCVNPSLLLGPGDRRLSSTGDVRKLMNRQIPTLTSGGVNFVDARDAAAAVVTALVAGKAGQRYLLGGPNWTAAEFFGKTARMAGVTPPLVKLPDKLSRWGASALEFVSDRLAKTPTMDRVSVEMSQHYWWFDSSKAMRELAFAPRDPLVTLADTIAYLRTSI
ncbi:MAG: NAD-dependent epimerase/dehydratase family protein [Myxococcales bacterium]|nr:NAD-dependent epimerase/dehydratase family protein [Myxococcales bacterium]